MFKRIDSNIFKKNKDNITNYSNMVTLYKQSVKNEYEGNVEKSTENYLQALSLLRSGNNYETFQSSSIYGIPKIIWTKIFLSLGVNHVCKMMSVSKTMYEVARDGRIWRQFYLESPYSK